MKERNTGNADMPVSPGPDKAPKVKQKRHPKVTLDMTRALVAVVNAPLVFIAPQLVLSDLEGEALAVALYDMSLANEFVAAIIHNLVTVNRTAELPLVVGAIVANKMVTLGKLPEGVTIATDVILQGVARKPIERAKAHGRKPREDVSGIGEESNVEAGGAPSSDRSNGERQDDVSEGTVETTVVRRRGGHKKRSDTVAVKLGEGEAAG